MFSCDDFRGSVQLISYKDLANEYVNNEDTFYL